ncbi:MAG: class D sortase [Coriobacteriales bacterium]|nr:class D sortase [Coriobacteriales bacterium]
MSGKNKHAAHSYEAKKRIPKTPGKHFANNSRFPVPSVFAKRRPPRLAADKAINTTCYVLAAICAIAVCVVISLLFSINDITGEWPITTAVVPIDNPDKIVSDINATIENDFMPALATDTLPESMKVSFTTNATAATQAQTTVMIDRSNYLLVPTSDTIKSALASSFAANGNEMSGARADALDSISDALSLRYAALANQVAASERAIYANLTLACYAIYAFIVVVLVAMIFMFWRVIKRHKGKCKPLVYCLAIILLPAALVFAVGEFGVHVPRSVTYTIDQSAVEPLDAAELGTLGIKEIDAPASPLTGDVIGHLDIASQGISQDILEGDTADNLLKSVCHYAPSALPGELGACIIAGHNYGSTWVSHDFSKIGDLAIGDTFTINTAWGDYTYKVTSNDHMLSTDIDLMGKIRDTSHRFVVMYTCDQNYGTTEYRYVVQAEQVSGPIVRSDD